MQCSIWFCSIVLLKSCSDQHLETKDSDLQIDILCWHLNVYFYLWTSHGHLKSSIQLSLWELTIFLSGHLVLLTNPCPKDSDQWEDQWGHSCLRLQMVRELPIRILRQLSVTKDRTLAEKVGTVLRGLYGGIRKSKSRILRFLIPPLLSQSGFLPACQGSISSSPFRDGLWKFQNSSRACNKP